MDTERLTPDMKLETLYKRKKWAEILNHIKEIMAKPREEREYIMQQWKDSCLLQRILSDAPDITPYLSMFSVDIPGQHERTALYFSVLLGNYNSSRVLLEAGADPNIADIIGETPAFRARDGKTVALLEQFGADLNIKNTSGRSPIEAMRYAHDCGKNGNLAALQYLQKKSGLEISIDTSLNSSQSTMDMPYYRKFGETYAGMYDIYDLCNEVCWDGVLPRCCIGFARLRDRIVAQAYPHGLCFEGEIYHEIIFNAPLFWFYNDNLRDIVLLMFHEMTHIWQYGNSLFGRRSAHGRDFKDEMARIGIDEKQDFIRDGSPADHAMREIQQRHPTLYQDVYELSKSKIKRPTNGDVRFFAEKFLNFSPKRNSNQ